MLGPPLRMLNGLAAPERRAPRTRSVKPAGPHTEVSRHQHCDKAPGRSMLTVHRHLALRKGAGILEDIFDIRPPLADLSLW